MRKRKAEGQGGLLSEGSMLHPVLPLPPEGQGSPRRLFT